VSALDLTSWILASNQVFDSRGSFHQASVGSPAWVRIAMATTSMFLTTFASIRVIRG